MLQVTSFQPTVSTSKTVLLLRREFMAVLFALRTIRAPVPWHQSYRSVKEYNNKNLFITNQVMMEIQNLWCDRLVRG